LPAVGRLRPSGDDDLDGQKEEVANNYNKLLTSCEEKKINLSPNCESVVANLPALLSHQWAKLFSSSFSLSTTVSINFEWESLSLKHHISVSNSLSYIQGWAMIEHG